MTTEAINYLIISPDSAFKQLIRFVLEGNFHVNIGLMDSPQLAMDYLRKIETFPHVIVYDYEANSYLVEDFVYYLKSTMKPIQVFILVENINPQTEKMFSTMDNFFLIEKKETLETICDLTRTLFAQIQSENTSDYCRVHIDCVGIIDGIDNDLHIGLSTGKYIKLFREDDVVDQFDIDRFRKKKVEFFYLKKETLDWVTDQLIKQFPIYLQNKSFRFILRSPSESPEKKFEQKIIRVCDQLHIDPEFRVEINRMSEKIYAVVQKNPNVQRVFQKIKGDQEKHSYISKRLQIMCLTTCALAKELEWHSKVTLEKLIYASIIHDLTIALKEPLLRIRDIHEFAKVKNELSPEDQDLYLKHPADAANLLKTAFHNAPPETHVVVLQHHELPDGSGFPFKASANRISPLSALFIISHDFTHYFLQDEDPLLADYVLKREKAFDVPLFRRVFKVVKKLRV